MKRGVPALIALVGSLAMFGSLVLGALASSARADGEVRPNGLSPEDIRASLERVHAKPADAPPNCRVREVGYVFDYHEITRRVLGRHWRDRTEAERVELVDLLRGHVLTWYTRLCLRQDFVQFEPIVRDGKRAVFSASAIRDGHKTSIVYRLRSSDEKQWLVYDVEAAGRSHTRMLYFEFDRVLLNEGYAELVARLTAEQEQRKAAKAQ